MVAEDEEHALELIQNGCVDDEEYTNDDSKNYNYNYDHATFHVRESNIEPVNSDNDCPVYPKHFLSELI